MSEDQIARYMRGGALLLRGDRYKDNIINMIASQPGRGDFKGRIDKLYVTHNFFLLK